MDYYQRVLHIIENQNSVEYTGIGSRQQTKTNFRVLVKIGFILAYEGKSVRSGAAHGSDEAFELGLGLFFKALTDKHTELLEKREMFFSAYRSIFLPWKNFRSRKELEPGVFVTPKGSPETRRITKEFHPNKNLSDRAASLMDRNSNQVLGINLDTPTSQIVGHTPDGATGEEGNLTTYKTGGTGQAIRIANAYKIPVSNIGNKDIFHYWEQKIESMRGQIQKDLNIDIHMLVDDYLDNFKGFGSVVYGDLVSSLKEGTHHLNAMVHGCNCFNDMGGGIAKAVSKVFPEAYDIDCQTKKGDTKKLGTYTSLSTHNDKGDPISVINAYTQYKYGAIKKNMSSPYVDYEKLRKVFTAINKDFAGKHIGIPKIGAGLAGGEWFIVARLIKESTPDVNITLFIL